jgi:mannose-1-phosphate guanylyltransferase
MRKIQDFGGFFDETTLVICGDALIDLDIRSALFEHKRKGALVSVITKEVPLEQVSSYGIVVTDNDGRVRSFQENRQEEALSRLASTGIYIMEPEVLDLIPSDTFFDIGSDLFPLIVEKACLYAQKRHFNWIDIGNVKDFLTVQLDILSGRVAQMYVPGVEVAERVWAGLNTRIDWDNIEIQGRYFWFRLSCGSRCKIIGPAWIGHGSHICKNTLVERSVLFEYTRIAEGSKVQDAVVYGDYTVSHSGEIRHISEFKDNLWNDARDRRQKPRVNTDKTD